MYSCYYAMYAAVLSQYAQCYYAKEGNPGE